MGLLTWFLIKEHTKLNSEDLKGLLSTILIILIPLIILGIIISYVTHINLLYPVIGFVILLLLIIVPVELLIRIIKRS